MCMEWYLEDCVVIESINWMEFSLSVSLSFFVREKFSRSFLRPIFSLSCTLFWLPTDPFVPSLVVSSTGSSKGIPLVEHGLSFFFLLLLRGLFPTKQAEKHWWWCITIVTLLHKRLHAFGSQSHPDTEPWGVGRPKHTQAHVSKTVSNTAGFLGEGPDKVCYYGQKVLSCRRLLIVLGICNQDQMLQRWLHMY